MKTISSTFRRLGQAALIVCALGVPVLATAPAQAASGGSQPQFSFSIQLDQGGGYDRQYHRQIHAVCLSDSAIVYELENTGFDNMRLGRRVSHNSVVAYGYWHRGYYSMTVNRCSGAVNQVQRIRIQRPPYNPHSSGYESGYDNGSYYGGYDNGYGGYDDGYYDGYQGGGNSFQFGFRY